MKNYLKFVITLFILTVVTVHLTFAKSNLGKSPANNSIAVGNAVMSAEVGNAITVTLVSEPAAVTVVPGSTKRIAADPSGSSPVPSTDFALLFKVKGEVGAFFDFDIDVNRSGSDKISLLLCRYRIEGLNCRTKYGGRSNCEDNLEYEESGYELKNSEVSFWFWPTKVQAAKDATPGDNTTFTVTVTVSYASYN